MNRNVPSEQTRFNVRSPKKSNVEVRALADYLDLGEASIVLLKFHRPHSFDPEPKNCFINVWVQCLHAEGTAQHGWIIGQDRANQFIEAQFHAVWVSPQGDIHDLTPRQDSEKRIMFLPDNQREIGLIEHDGKLAIKSFDNVRVWQGRLTTPLTPIVVEPETEMIRKFGLDQAAFGP